LGGEIKDYIEIIETLPMCETDELIENILNSKEVLGTPNGEDKVE